MNCDAAKVEPVEAKIELNWEFQPGSEACQDPTMGGGQLHCIGLTTRTIPPSLTQTPQRPLPGTPPSTLSPFNKNYHCPLCPACRNDCKPLKAVLSSQGLGQLNCNALKRVDTVGVVFMAPTRIHQDIFIRNTQWWLRSCSGIYGARYLLNVGEKS